MKKNHEEQSPKRKERPNNLIFVYQRTKSKQLAGMLILTYRHLVGSAAKKLARNHPDLYDDLYQVGQLSLLRSLERYDHGHGSSFEAYARKGITGSMMNYLRDKAWAMPIPRWMKDQWVKVQRAVTDLTVKLERQPSVREVARYTRLPMDLTEKVLAGQASYQVTSLDAPLTNEQGEFTLADLIGMEAREYYAVETRLDMNEALTRLNDRERRILDLNFMQGESQRTIAKRLGMSQMTVSRIIRQALNKLRQGLSQPVLSS